LLAQERRRLDLLWPAALPPEAEPEVNKVVAILQLSEVGSGTTIHTDDFERRQG